MGVWSCRCHANTVDHYIANYCDHQIIEYLIENYDKSEKLTYSSFPEKYHLKQWLFFQVSGQGPYFGQAAW